MKIFRLLPLVLAAGSLIAQAPAQVLPGAPVAAAEDMVSPDTIQFPNNPVSDFLLVYERLKGVTLIKDASLSQGGLNLSLTLNQPVTKEEAIRLIESTLLLNGYAFIAVDKKTVKVINTAGGKNPRSEGVFVFTNEEELPQGEVIASYVIPLTHLAAADAVEIFNQFIVLHPYGSMVAVPVANQVLITENSSLIRRLLEVRTLVDQPAPEPKNEFVQLKQANAKKVVELITKVLEKRASATSSTTARAAAGQAAQPPGSPALPSPAGTSGGVTISMGEGGAVSGDIQLIADERTNRILIVTRPSNLSYIKDLIEKFDVPVELSDPYEKKLNYVSAKEMLPILLGALYEPEGSSDEKAPGVAESGGIGLPAGGATGGPTGVTGVGIGGSSSGAIPDRLTEPGMDQAADIKAVGTTRIISDNRANSILVIGQPEAKEKVARILESLDKRPLQVYLATVIGNLTVDNNDSFAANILSKYMGGPKTGAAAVAGGRSIISAGSNGVTPLTPSAATLQQMAQVASGALPGMQIATFIAGSIDLYIQALTATSKFRIAARPAIFTANNKKAVIFNGRKIAVPTSTVTTLGSGGSATATSGSQQSNIQYQDVVLKIEVVPLINNSREITLKIVQTNNKVIPGAGTEIGGGVTVPEISTQELTTTVTIPDQATILLGGLVTQTDEKTTSGVPFLSTVPLMGNLFRSSTDSTRKEELVVLIQPSVVKEMLEIDAVSKTERDLTDFSSKDLTPLSMKLRDKKAENMQLQIPVEPIKDVEGN